MNVVFNGNFIVTAADTDADLKGIKQFDCGDKELNGYLQQLKRQVGRDNIKALVLKDGASKVGGFVTAKLFQMTRDDVPEGTFMYTLPPEFVVMKVPMLAIDKQLQKQGWGEEMMRAILDYCVESADQVKGIKGVYIDAKTHLRSFYESLDFEAMSNHPSANDTIPMFISMDTLRESQALRKSA